MTKDKSDIGEKERGWLSRVEISVPFEHTSPLRYVLVLSTVCYMVFVLYSATAGYGPLRSYGDILCPDGLCNDASCFSKETDPTIGNTTVAQDIAEMSHASRPVHVQRLQKLARFLKDQYIPSAGLLRAAPTVESNILWLVSDNLLAYYALEEWYPELSCQVHSSLLIHGSRGTMPLLPSGLPRSYHHEAILGYTIPRGYRGLRIIEIDLVEGYKVMTASFDVWSSLMWDWGEYSDCLLYQALSRWYDGDQSEALILYRKALSLWDGYGFADKQYLHDSYYDTYKLALALRASRVMRQDLPMKDYVEDRIWACQREDGGIRTAYRRNGEVLGDANVETASTILIAYKNP